MQTLAGGYRGLSLLLRLNSDRLLYTGALCLALSIAALLGSV
jgi:hypothetical protein